MWFVMTCEKCGNQVKSPERRDAWVFEEFQKLVKEMGLRCRLCGGEVIASAEG